VGDPLDKNTDIGAIKSREQLEKIKEMVASGKKEGAELFQPACKLPAKGFFYAPSFFTGVTDSHRIAQEEIFGPVLSVMTFRTPEEALERANNTPYGLSAGIWTDKGSKVFKLATQLRAGVVWAETYNKFDPASPFGGYKESGFGREGGKQGVVSYLKLDDLLHPFRCVSAMAGRGPVRVVIRGSWLGGERAGHDENLLKGHGLGVKVSLGVAALGAAKKGVLLGRFDALDQ
jgi:acyl-CoA reductase-like NAD-dependent aldehyde dehydrogenase